MCLWAATISAAPEAFVNSFTEQLVPTAPIATVFSPSPLTVVIPPVEHLRAGDFNREIFNYQASVAPAADLRVPIFSPVSHTLSVNSFEHQYELHGKPVSEPHAQTRFSVTTRPPNTPHHIDDVVRADFIDGLQTIKSSKQSFEYKHGSEVRIVEHGERPITRNVGFRVYGLPERNENRPTFEAKRPEPSPVGHIFTLPVESRPIEVQPVITHQPHPISHPSPALTLPLEYGTPAVSRPLVQIPVAQRPVVQEPIARPPIVHHPIVHQPIDHHPIDHHPIIQPPVFDQHSIRPLLILTPPLESHPIDSQIVPTHPAEPIHVEHPQPIEDHHDDDFLPIHARPAIFAPAPAVHSSSPPLFHNAAPASPVVALPNIPIAPRVEATNKPDLNNDLPCHGDQNLFSNEYTSPDGTKVTENGQLFSTADGWENVVAKCGSYEYISPEGTPIKVKWIADQRGFRLL